VLELAARADALGIDGSPALRSADPAEHLLLARRVDLADEFRRGLEARQAHQTALQIRQQLYELLGGK
jgi:hypothetical protein